MLYSDLFKNTYPQHCLQTLPVIKSQTQINLRKASPVPEVSSTFIYEHILNSYVYFLLFLLPLRHSNSQRKCACHSQTLSKPTLRLCRAECQGVQATSHSRILPHSFATFILYFLISAGPGVRSRVSKCPQLSNNYQEYSFHPVNI